MSPRHGWLLSIGLACWLAFAASAGPTSADKTPRRDRHGDPLPAGVLARLGTTRFRVGDANRCLALSADGAMLATGGGSSVRLWNAVSGEELRSVHVPVFSVFAVMFSPDGKHFAALGDHMGIISRPISNEVDHSLFVGEVASGKILHQYRGGYTSAVFTHDSKYLFARGGSPYEEDAEHPVIVWNVASGKEARRFPAVVSYALSPDGKLLAGGNKQGVIYLWDANTGTERRQLKGHSNPILALAFSPDSRTLASASGDCRGVGLGANEQPAERENTVRLWDVTAGKASLPARRHNFKVKRLRFAPDGKTLAAVNEADDLALYDVVTGRLRQRFPRDPQRGLTFAFAPDSKSLLYCRSSRIAPNRETFYQWDIGAGKEMRQWCNKDGYSSNMAFSRDGKTLFSLGDALHIWDVASGVARHEDEDHRFVLEALTFSADGKTLAMLDVRKNLRLWDVQRGAPLPALSAQRVARYVFTPDGRLLMTVDTDATVSVREIPSGKIVRCFRAGTEATVRRWEDVTNSAPGQLNLREHPRACCVFDRARRLLAVVGEDQNIHLWDTLRGEELRRLEGHRGLIYDLIFSPEGQWLFSCGEDRTFRWWNVGDGVEIQRFSEEGRERGKLALAEDGRLLAWTYQQRIHLWDLPTRKELRVLKGHPGGTNRILLERDGSALVSTGADLAIHYWDTQSGLELRTISAGEYEHTNMDLLISPNGRILAHASMEPKNSRMLLRDVASGIPICTTHPWNDETFALSADGKTAVVTGDKLVFREAASGGIVAETPARQRGHISCLAFSPDGTVLATGGVDSTVLLWDWRRLCGLTHDPAAKVTDKEVEALWLDLASPDARRAYRAVGVLTASADKAVTLLRTRLRPAAAGDALTIRQRIAELDDNDFTVREKASRELADLGVEAYFFLRKVPAEKVSLEMRRRLQLILASPEMKRLSGESLRKIRAVQVLEAIGTPAARELLAAWSRGDAGAWLTRDAQSSLRRLLAVPARE